jgi:tRNA(His) 5'-end guanylyltransferase
MKDVLGDKIKAYERDAETRPSGNLPIIVRLDGKNFSKWTKGLAKPYDTCMSEIMRDVTTALVQYCNSTISYTQSDEISLVITRNSGGGELFFGGRYQKLASVLASLATYTFNQLVSERMPSKKGKMALFDARVFEVPSIEDAVNVLEWRADDCRRNSVSCLAQTKFSHKELQLKNVGEMKGMLKAVGASWDDTPEFYRNGYYVKRTKTLEKFTCDEISELPEKHTARTNPDLLVERTKLEFFTTSILDAEDKLKFIGYEDVCN